MQKDKLYIPEHLTKWTRSDNYGGEDLSEYYPLITITRDSYILDVSNYETIKAELESQFEIDGELIIVANFGHWACGWIESIMIHETHIKALQFADEVKEALNNYPVYDDEDYSKREYDLIYDYVTDYIVKDFLNDNFPDDDFTEDQINEFSDKLQNIVDFECTGYDEVHTSCNDEDIKAYLTDITGLTEIQEIKTINKITDNAWLNGHVLSAWFSHYDTEASDCINCKTRFTLDTVLILPCNK